MGLNTLFGIKKQGFFIPYRHADGVQPTDYPALIPHFESAVPETAELIGEIEKLAPLFFAMNGPAPEPRFDQDWFTGLDALFACAVLSKHQPKRVIEIGSGHSTRFMARMIKDLDLDCELTAIDPAPRAAIHELAVRHIASKLEETDPATFDVLGPADVLFIDSSHILMPGTDVDRLFNGIMPKLQRGTIVHIHDVFLPWRYPDDWSWRGYNEQNAAAPLIHSMGYRILASSHYVRSKDWSQPLPTFIDQLSMPDTALETSLWLEKTV